MLTVSIIAQEEQQMEQSQQDAAMKAWNDFMTPGNEHAMLAKGTGEWKVSQKFWMMPGSEPMETEGTAVVKNDYGRQIPGCKSFGECDGYAV